MKIKYLAPYLDYHLNLARKKDYLNDNWSDYEIEELVQLHKEYNNTIHIGTQTPKFFSCFESNQFKPIFRPISDLVNEIEINGISFVPILELAKIIWGDIPFEIHKDRVELITNYSTSLYENSRYKTFSYKDNSFIFNVLDSDLKIIGCYTVKNQLELFENLFKWHFDVFDLIKSGNAIDIHEIKKVKGEKHAGSSKVKTLANVDVEKLESVRDFIDYAVTQGRFNQGIENTFPNEEPINVKKMGDLIRWVVNDIIKEESDTLAENGLEPKDVNSQISGKVREMFFKLTV